MRGSCLVLLGLLAGCQSGFSVDTSESNFCDEYAEVICHNLYQCCTEEQIEDSLGVTEPRTEVQCREDKKRECVRGSAQIRDSLQNGRVTFNAEALDACLTAYAAPEDTCATYVTELPWAEACKEQAFVGAVASGGACFFDHDCAGAPESAECGPDQKCVALPTGGAPCPTGACAAGFFCGTTQTCQAKLAEGATCTSTAQCQTDLFCDTTATPTPTCTARQPAGSSCTSNAGCESGECVPGRCMGSTQACYNDTQCSAHCANSSAFCSIGFDYTCNTAPGHCDTITTTACSGSTADSQCVNAGAGTTCIFEVSCVPGDCIGDPVCTAPLFLADYCAIGIGITP